MLVTCLLWAGFASAQSIYRCPGNIYQHEPCRGGKVVAINPNVNLLTLPKRDEPATLAADADSRGAGQAVAIPRTPQMPYQPSVNSGSYFYTPPTTSAVGVR